MKYATIAASLFGIALAAPAPAPTPAATLEERQAGVGASNPSRTLQSFSASGVIPTLIPSFAAGKPQIDVSATYGSKKVDLGTVFTTAETLAPPELSFTAPKGYNGKDTFSLFLVDPDVPGPNGLPVVEQPRINFLHYYISGLKPNGANKGNVVTIYEPLTPVSPMEQHRYTFLVYKEPAGYKPNPIGAQVRPAFDLLGYTTKGGLGSPLGGNFLNESITNGILPGSPS